MNGKIINKRQYFRVDDAAELYLQPMQSVEETITHDHFSSLIAPEDALFFKILEETQQINREIIHRLTEVEKQQPLIAQLLRRMNEKTTVTIHYLLSVKARSRQVVNLSIGGMGFYDAMHYQEGQTVAIKLILHPTMIVLTVKGQVLSSIPTHASQNRVSVVFLDTSAEDKDLLSYHINDVQRRQIQVDKAQHN